MHQRCLSLRKPEEGGPRSERHPRGVVCTFGAVGKFVGGGPEGWGRNSHRSDKKKAGGRVGLRNPEKAGPRNDGQQEGDGREALTPQAPCQKVGL